MVELTMRDRMLAVVKGEELDRVPFVQYDGLAAPNEEVWSHIGREEMGILRWTRLCKIHYPNCSTRHEPIERDGLEGQITTIETPRGSMTEQRYFEPTYHTGWIDRHFVTEADDYDALQAYFEDCVVVADMADLHRARRELGDDGLPLARVERTPFQQLWIQWVGIDNLALHLADCPDRVAACIDAMVHQQRRIFEIVARAPVDFVDFPDNITAPIIGETYFRQYCSPHYDELAGMLGGDVPVFVHMDGDLRPLWEAIGQTSVSGIDSLSPPPDNDTSPADAIAMWPHMSVLVNFPSSVHLASPQDVYAKTSELLEQAGHSGRLQIQISENVPRYSWRASFPEIVRAIRDFGRP